MTKGRLPRTLSSALRAGWGPLSTTQPWKGVSSSWQQRRADVLEQTPGTILPMGKVTWGSAQDTSPQPRSQCGCIAPAPAQELLPAPSSAGLAAAGSALWYKPNPRPPTKCPPHAQTAHAAVRGGVSLLALASLGMCTSSCRTARAAARIPGLLMGGDGLGQPIQAVQVVVGGQVLLAGGTDGSSSEASSKHTYTGGAVVRVSSEPAQLGPEQPRIPPGAPRTPRQRLVLAPCTWHVGGLLQAVVGAAVLGALHKVRWLVHVLGREWKGRERTGCPHCRAGAQQKRRAGASELQPAALRGPHSQSTCHQRALGHGSPSPCRATTRESQGW